MREYPVFYQLKAIRKNTKPPIWRRILLPGNITFGQLALLLERMLTLPDTNRYELEFYQKQERLIEWTEQDGKLSDYKFTYRNAPDTYINSYLDQEKWFTFRLRSLRQETPEYRVEIEKRLEKSMELTHQITGEKMRLLFPAVTVQKSPQEDPYWSGLDELNEELRTSFALYPEQEETYRNHAELKAEIEAQKGLGYVAKETLTDQELHTYPSIQSSLQKTAESLTELFQKSAAEEVLSKLKVDEQTGNILNSREEVAALLEKWKQSNEEKMRQEAHRQMGESVQNHIEAKYGKNATRKPKVAEMLKVYSKDDLVEMAREAGIRTGNMRKNQLVEAYCRALLDPSWMRRVFLDAEEEELDAFERALDRKLFWPEPEERELLEFFVDENYISEFKDSMLEVPEEVKFLYQILKDHDYRKFHRQGRALLDCFRVFEMLYVVGPLDVLLKMMHNLTRQKMTRKELLELYHKVDFGECQIIGDRVIAENAVKNQIYLGLEKRQREVPYYIPSGKEIQAFAEDVVAASGDAYEELQAFFHENMHLPWEIVELLSYGAFQTFSTGGMPSDYFELLDENGVEFDSEEQAQQLVSLLMKVNNQTRMFELRGHSPEEMAQFAPKKGAKNGRTKVVPMSSLAAQMLETSSRELKNMGLDVDTDATAASIPGMFLPDGAKGSGKLVTRKVYPNDPCPCGSGKKYKKCCGKK